MYRRLNVENSCTEVLCWRRTFSMKSSHVSCVRASSVELLVKEIVYGFWYSLDDVMEVIKELEDKVEMAQTVDKRACDVMLLLRIELHRMQLSYPSQRPSIFSFLSISSSARGSNYFRYVQRGRVNYILLSIVATNWDEGDMQISLALSLHKIKKLFMQK